MNQVWGVTKEKVVAEFSALYTWKGLSFTRVSSSEFPVLSRVYSCRCWMDVVNDRYAWLVFTESCTPPSFTAAPFPKGIHLEIHKSPDGSPGTAEVRPHSWMGVSVWAAMGDTWGQEVPVVKQVWGTQHTELTLGGFPMLIAKFRLQEPCLVMKLPLFLSFSDEHLSLSWRRYLGKCWTRIWEGLENPYPKEAILEVYGVP